MKKPDLLSEPETLGDSAGKQKSLAQRRHRSIGIAGCWVGMVVGVAGLLLGRMGHLWIAFDVFAQFTLQFAFVGLAFAIGMFMPRAKVMVSCAIFAALVIAYGLSPFMGNASVGEAKAGPAAAAGLKIASFNTWMENSDPPAVIAELQRMDADVVTLIEFGHNKQQFLPQLRSLYPYQADCAEDTHCNFVILSKVPLTTVSSQSIWEGPPYLHAVMGGKFKGLNVVAVHTTRFPHSRAQYKQMKALSVMLQGLPGSMLVMGDFNSTPYSRLAAILPMEVNLRRLTSLPSWPASFGLPQLAIDHVYVSQGIVELTPEQLGNPAGSDHFPISMQIEVPSALLAN